MKFLTYTFPYLTIKYIIQMVITVSEWGIFLLILGGNEQNVLPYRYLNGYVKDEVSVLIHSDEDDDLYLFSVTNGKSVYYGDIHSYTKLKNGDGIE